MAFFTIKYPTYHCVVIEDVTYLRLLDTCIYIFLINLFK